MNITEIRAGHFAIMKQGGTKTRVYIQEVTKNGKVKIVNCFGAHERTTPETIIKIFE